MGSGGETERVEILQQQREELSRREAALEVELLAVEAEISRRPKPRLPLLDDVRIASPCNERWEAMRGDDQVRFCEVCQKNVYNLSAMLRRDAESLLRERGGSICVRLYRRADGTVMTADCPVGVKRKRRKRAAVAAGTGAMAVAAALASWGSSKAPPPVVAFDALERPPAPPPPPPRAVDVNSLPDAKPPPGPPLQPEGEVVGVGLRF